MNAGLLDVLHDAADDDRAGRIGDGVDVELERVLEELVDQDRMSGRRRDRVGHVAIERGGVVDDRHRAAAEHVRRPHDEREADLRRDSRASSTRRRRAARRLRDAELPQQLREALAVLGQVDRVGRGAEDPDARRLQRSASFSGVCPPNCTSTRRRRPPAARAR